MIQRGKKITQVWNDMKLSKLSFLGELSL